MSFLKCYFYNRWGRSSCLKLSSETNIFVYIIFGKRRCIGWKIVHLDYFLGCMVTIICRRAICLPRYLVGVQYIRNQWNLMHFLAHWTYLYLYILQKLGIACHKSRKRIPHLLARILLRVQTRFSFTYANLTLSLLDTEWAPTYC